MPMRGADAGGEPASICGIVPPMTGSCPGHGPLGDLPRIIPPATDGAMAHSGGMVSTS